MYIMSYITFNPIYILKPNDGSTLLLPKELIRENGVVKGGSEFVLHPLHAMILNFVNGEDYNETIEKIAIHLKVDKVLVKKFVDVLLDNPQFVKLRGKALPDSYYLPPMTIISSDKKRKTIYPPEAFLTDKIDIRHKRHISPTNLTLMVNNKCVTDCFYCYADKRKPVDCSISLERLEQLIEEARTIGVKNIDVIGGEFFLYEYWKELLSVLHKNDYYPYLSTKVPLNEEVVKNLAELKIKDLQISLDTLVEEHLSAMLQVKGGYIEKLKKTFLLLNEFHIPLYVHTILTSKNDSVDDMQSVFNFIKSFDNVKEWKLDVAAPTLYRQYAYDIIKPKEHQVDKIINYLKTIEKSGCFDIIYPRKLSYIIQEKDKERQFNNRAICTGNYSNLFILPDGNVTICEELYWHERFIIGNVKKQNLMEVWNSKEAVELYYLSQKEIPKDSKCSRCTIYTECRQGKGICWKSVIKEFGKDKWYYPDPLCTR